MPGFKNIAGVDGLDENSKRIRHKTDPVRNLNFFMSWKTCSWKTRHFNSSSHAFGATHVEMKICSPYKPTLGASQPLRQRSQQRRWTPMSKDPTGPQSEKLASEQ